MYGPAKSIRRHIDKSKEWIALYKNHGKEDESCLDQAIYHMMVAQKTIKEIEDKGIYSIHGTEWRGC